MKEAVQKMADRALLFALPVAILGSIFKTMHYPYANQMLIVGLGSVALAAYLKYAFEKTIDGYVTGAAIALGCLAVLFKLMHWGQADLLMKLAIIAGFIWGVRIFFPGKKASDEE